MLRHAWSRGIVPSQDVLDDLSMVDDTASLTRLAMLHASLARTVAPATPICLMIMATDTRLVGWRAMFGPIANVRRLMLAVLCFEAVFIGISMTSALNLRTVGGDVYTLADEELLVVITFLLSAAGIGASFQALFTAQRYVEQACYEPRYDASYWIRIVLGLVAGLLLSVLIPVEVQSTSSGAFAKPVLALLGGFSATLVYRILQRLVDTVDGLFNPPAPSRSSAGADKPPAG